MKGIEGLTQDFTNDYYYMVDRIFHKKIPTAFVRYNEGEYWLVSKKGFRWAGNFWKTYEDKTKLAEDMLGFLGRSEANFFYGVATKQHGEANERLKKNIKSPNITFATLFANNNWKFFQHVITNIDEEVVLVCNEVGVSHRNYPFKIADIMPVPYDVVAFYEEHKDKIISDIKKLASQYSNTLFLFSAGPLSNALIDYAWEENKTNRYIDMWSTLDEYIHWGRTRQYFYPDRKTYNQIDLL